MIFHDRRTGTLHEINDSTIIRHANATRQIINNGMGGGVETLQDPKGKVDWESAMDVNSNVFDLEADFPHEDLGPTNHGDYRTYR